MAELARQEQELKQQEEMRRVDAELRRKVSIVVCSV